MNAPTIIAALIVLVVFAAIVGKGIYNRRLAIGQKILGLPVIAIYKGGEKVAECVKDDATVENIKAMIEANL